MTEYAGRGDPRRSMTLLWGLGDAPGRGPKPGLSVAAITDAAIALADAEGLGALSMRRVAEQLGKSPMSLYTYVPGKAELLDLMLDRVLGELPKEYPAEAGWRAAVETAARTSWAFYQRHSWVLQVSGGRAALGPHEFDFYESQLRPFDGLGLTGVEVARAAGVLMSFVRGSAKAVSDAAAAEQATGISDDEWWNARAPFFEELPAEMWPERYPTLTRLQAEHAFDQLDRPDETTSYLVQEALDIFEFGLQRLLDGLETFITSRSGDGAGTGSTGRAEPHPRLQEREP
jgi:AcrR family transcriptional regulator